MKTQAEVLAARYRMAHDEMRSIDGLQPSEALDELLKYLLVKTGQDLSGEALPNIDVFSSNEDRIKASRQLRGHLTQYLDRYPKYAEGLFPLRDFCLTDSCLAKVHEILGSECFTALPFDVRSAALRAFLSPKLRKGLGIFLTPDSVVEQIVDFFEFENSAVVADPACGSGTFLLAAAQKTLNLTNPIKLYGIDKSPRMMLLADLNAGPSPRTPFMKRVCDTLRPDEYSDFLANESVDIILTNPPFGVRVDNRSYDLSDFSVASAGDSRVPRRQSSELLFMERCLSLLKPDGLLAIILPMSAVNTISSQQARCKLAEVAGLLAVITLPPETFSVTGTMSNTVVLFLRKFGDTLKPTDHLMPAVARIDNVGYDATGRARHGSELPGIGSALSAACKDDGSDSRITRAAMRRADATLPSLPKILQGERPLCGSVERSVLGDFVSLAVTGSTPPRSAYSSKGLFLVKVGNLTGAGINWIPRSRNFVDSTAAIDRCSRSDRLLKIGDIVLTSSAHSPKYIARKVDVIQDIPKWIGGMASFVGEVMLLRVDQKLIDPFVLAAYLRLPSVIQDVQYMVRGQTAHLYPGDMLSLEVNKSIISDPLVVEKLAPAIKQEALLSVRMNEIAWQQMQVASTLVGGVSDSG